MATRKGKKTPVGQPSVPEIESDAYATAQQAALWGVEDTPKHEMDRMIRNAIAGREDMLRRTINAYALLDDREALITAAWRAGTDVPAHCLANGPESTLLADSYGWPLCTCPKPPRFPIS